LLEFIQTSYIVSIFLGILSVSAAVRHGSNCYYWLQQQQQYAGWDLCCADAVLAQFIHHSTISRAIGVQGTFLKAVLAIWRCNHHHHMQVSSMHG
jgi:hypothetical protein